MPADDFQRDQSIGRLEGKLDQIIEHGRERSAKIDQIMDRQSDDYHRLAGAQQNTTSQIETLNRRSDATAEALNKLSERVAKIEAPIRRAVQQRAERRKLWVKIVSVASAVSAGVWVLAEPIWKLVTEQLMHRWFGPPHP